MSQVLKKAISIARSMDETMGAFRMCAIVVDKRDRIISIGMNSYSKTSPIMAKYAKRAVPIAACMADSDFARQYVNSSDIQKKTFLHAECHALKQLSKEHKAHKIYIARVNRSGEVGMAAPCPICVAAIKDYGITAVEHTI